MTRISPEPRVTRMSSRRRDGRRYIRRARRRPWPAAAFRASAGTGRGRADLVEPGGGEAVLVAGRECGGQGGVQAGAVLRRLPPRASLCQRPIGVSESAPDRSIRARTIGVYEPGRSEYPSQDDRSIRARTIGVSESGVSESWAPSCGAPVALPASAPASSSILPIPHAQLAVGTSLCKSGGPGRRPTEIGETRRCVRFPWGNDLVIRAQSSWGGDLIRAVPADSRRNMKPGPDASGTPGAADSLRNPHAERSPPHGRASARQNPPDAGPPRALHAE